MVSGAGEGEAGPSWSHERAPRAERTLAEEETHIQLGEDGWAEGEARKKDPTGKQAAGDQMALPPVIPWRSKAWPAWSCCRERAGAREEEPRFEACL